MHFYLEEPMASINPSESKKGVANTMSKQEKILGAVYRAVDEVNRQLPEGTRIKKSTSTVLLGESRNLDSLAFISLIVAVEQEIEDAFQMTINLTDNTDAIYEKNSPLYTIEALVHDIFQLMEAK